MNGKFLSVLLLSSASSVALAQPLQFDYMGKKNIGLTHIYAVQENGTRSPDNDQACHKQLRKYIGHQLVLTYNINKQTGLQKAKVSFEGREFALYPMGIMGEYGFMSDDSSNKPILRVIATLTQSFSPLNGSVLFSAQGKGSYNCVLASGDMLTR